MMGVAEPRYEGEEKPWKARPLFGAVPLLRVGRRVLVGEGWEVEGEEVVAVVPGGGEEEVEEKEPDVVGGGDSWDPAESEPSWGALCEDDLLESEPPTAPPIIAPRRIIEIMATRRKKLRRRRPQIVRSGGAPAGRVSCTWGMTPFSWSFGAGSSSTT